MEVDDIVRKGMFVCGARAGSRVPEIGLANSHLETAIDQAAQAEVRGLGIATVYRNIKALLEARWLSSVDLRGATAVYEPGFRGGPPRAVRSKNRVKLPLMNPDPA